MRRNLFGHYLRLAILVIFTVISTLPKPALADGGPVLSDPERWAQLKESQQIAVITLDSDNTAHVNLFISMLDTSGETHEIVFFIPLGVGTANFTVTEKTSFQFDQELTEELDQILDEETKRASEYARDVNISLLVGSLMVNGGWSWPIWIPLLLSNCGAAPAPTATFDTESSQVSIYDLEENVDLQELINTTGLDPEVKETLSRFKGQQIAIINLQTVLLNIERSSYESPGSQPGIHLSWDTKLVPREKGMVYTYPLGTGSAWAHPIEITRIYIVSPAGIDFDPQYPTLGEDYSGFAGGIFSHRVPRILYAYDPAFAVENVVGDFGKVWRATYVRSNSTEDIVITRLDELSSETKTYLRRMQLHRPVRYLTWLLSLVVSATLWVTAWRFVMFRVLGVQYDWRDMKLWREALGWAILYPLTNVAAIFLTLIIAGFTAGLGLILGIPLMLITSLGLITAFAFGRMRSSVLGVTRRRAEFAYAAVVLLTNALYIPLATGYAALVGAL